MAKKDLKYFMREQKEEIVTVPGPSTFVDENGTVIDLEIRVLSSARIQEINDLYQKKSVAIDKKGKPFISPQNEIAFKVTRDNVKASRHMMVEALAYPDLKDPELMKFYNCVDVTEMPVKVFSKADEFAYLSKIILQTLGLSDEPEDDKDVEDAKN